MYNTQEIAGRIKIALKEQGFTNESFTKQMGIGVNRVSEFAKGKEMSCIKLAEIADFLNISVDYLLGRNPPQNIAIGNVTGNNSGNAGNTNCSFGATSEEVPEEALEIAKMLKSLNFKDRAALMSLIAEFVENHNK